MAPANVLAFATLKGGVGKTSLTANLAGESAHRGQRTCAIDLDPQGDLSSDLGLRQRGLADDGANLASALRGEVALRPWGQVRPNLDVIQGGWALRSLLDQPAPAVISRLGQLIADLGSRYDLVLVDCPPTAGPLLTSALSAAHHVIVPTRGDKKSLDGMVRLSDEFDLIRREHNRRVDVLGVVLFGFPRVATRQLDIVRAEITGDLGDSMLLFDQFIRRLDSSVLDMQRKGELAIDDVRDEGSPAAGLAEDYRMLFSEIIQRMALVEARRTSHIVETGVAPKTSASRSTSRFRLRRRAARS